MDATAFSRELLQLSSFTNGNIVTVIKKSCIDLYRAVVEKTPVEFGNAKASWALTLFPHTERHSGGASGAEIANIVRDNASTFEWNTDNEFVLISNNLNYIGFLENGSSTQAPAGMVAISLSEFEHYFRNAIAGLRGIET